MVDMTLNDLYTKVKVIHFGTNRFIYDFLQGGPTKVKPTYIFAGNIWVRR